MPKPSKNEIWEEMQDSMKYKWEFVRRNKKYRKACDDFRAKYDSRVDFMVSDEENNDYNAIAGEYGFPILDYNIDFMEYKRLLGLLNNIVESTKLSITEKRNLSFLKTFWDQYLGHSIVSLEGYSDQSIFGQLYLTEPVEYKRMPFIGDEKELKDAKTLQVSINLECPKKQILEYVSASLDFVNKYRESTDNKKKQIMQYASYLSVYDIMENLLSQGVKIEKAYEEVAKKTFGGEYDRSLVGEKLGGDKKDPQSVIRKAKRYYEEAKRLVGGGFRQIS